jgi:hypothetical protein
MPPNVYEKVHRLVYEEKKFSTVSDCITQALISFIDNQNGAGKVPEMVEAYLFSEDGRDLMRKVTRQTMMEILATPQNCTEGQQMSTTCGVRFARDQ